MAMTLEDILAQAGGGIPPRPGGAAPDATASFGGLGGGDTQSNSLMRMLGNPKLLQQLRGLQPRVGGVVSPRLPGRQVPGFSSYRDLGRLGQTAAPQDPRGGGGERMRYNRPQSLLSLLGGR